MGFDPFSRVGNGPRTTRVVLLVIILLTLPCYCLGAVLLAYAPEGDNPPGDGRPTLGGATASPGVSPTWTPFRTATWTPQGGPLQPTPLQLYLRTPVPYVFPTWTLTPTFFIYPSPTTAPSITAIPTNTLAATSIPTNTLAATIQPTEALPTDEPTPIEQQPVEPTPTQEGGL
jgi:hypothetical protein